MLACCVLCESSVDSSHAPNGTDTGADGALSSQHSLERVVRVWKGVLDAHL